MAKPLVLDDLIKLRMTKQEADQVRKAAEKLDLTLSDFVRWCVTESAKAVLTGDRVKIEAAFNTTGRLIISALEGEND